MTEFFESTPLKWLGQKDAIISKPGEKVDTSQLKPDWKIQNLITTNLTEQKARWNKNLRIASIALSPFIIPITHAIIESGGNQEAKPLFMTLAVLFTAASVFSSNKERKLLSHAEDFMQENELESADITYYPRGNERRFF
ncbi:hypothetical protein ACFL1M_03550 [Patescibacteria group bacterium]